jgi:hypothetical protein
MVGLARLSAGIAATALLLATGVARADWTMPSSLLPDATRGVAYAFQFTVSGGSGGYEWAVVDIPRCGGFGAYCAPGTGLPPGLSLSQAGLLQGTPATSGDFTFWVNVSDNTGASGYWLYALHVRPSAAWAFSTWVPVASHTSGLNGSEWRSDVWLLNPGASAADVELEFHGAGGIMSSTASVPAGAQLTLADVVGQLGGTGSGALEVLSDQPVKVASRTYDQFQPDASCFPGGTEGQDYPRLDPVNGLQGGQIAFLPGLAENARFRSNIGLVNTGFDVATVAVELYDGLGSRLTQYSVPLASGEWSQAVQPFRTPSGPAAVDNGYAKITVQSGAGVFAFASLIDNLTNDPTTVMGTSSGDFVPVASHVSGLNGAEWRTDVAILNPNPLAALVIVYFFGASGPLTETWSVPKRTQLMFADIVGQLGARGSGALAVAMLDRPVEITSRTYSELSSAACLPGGTQGQDYPVLDPNNGLQAQSNPYLPWVTPQTAYLPGLIENANFRSNIGLINLGSQSATVLVELYDGSGGKLTEYTVPLELNQWSQAVEPFRKMAGQTAIDSGYARITVQEGSGVFGFASVVDNTTNDPTTVTMQR